MKKIFFTLIFLIAGFMLQEASAQGSEDYGSGLKLNINKEGDKYIRFIFWNQIWARSIKNNPGTLVGGEPSDRTFDIGARRIRTIAYAQISPRYLIMAHFGINNHSFINGGANGTSGTGPNGAGKKPQLFYHDVWNEYAIVPNKNIATGKDNKTSLYAGAGLHYWNGISRLTSASTLNFLMIDAPLFNWPTLEVSDQFVRQFGLYAKGHAGKLHYRLNLNKPFATNQTSVPGGAAVDNNGDPKLAFGGYADYQFLDQESAVLPFRVGTYLGTKKVLNIGAGFYSTKDGTRSMQSDNMINKHDINIFAADVFADLPIGDKSTGMAVTASSTFYNYDFGPNYIRTTGVMNPGATDAASNVTKAQEGAGNARYMLGTGQIWYTQTGLLLPKNISKKIRIQPVAAYTYKNLQALDEGGHYYDVGSNFYIDGHNAKITLQYSNRPLYHQNKVFTRAGEWQLQFQIYL